VYGLETFDGGGGLTVFLYSGTVSLMIWVLCIRGKVAPERYRIKESYINQTLSFIGVMIAFVNWPKFNMAGSTATTYLNPNVNTTNISSSYLQNSALANTFLGLSAALLTSILFASKDAKEDKLKFQTYVDCFINVLLSLYRVGLSLRLIRMLRSTLLFA
jgi:ammonia channel protein AmtB